MTLSFAARYWDGTDAREITVDLDHPVVLVHDRVLLDEGADEGAAQ